MGGPYDWKFQSAPQQGLDRRILGQPRGRGLGGSSLINALGFQRGPHQAYDDWAVRTGDEGWSFERLLPYFKRLETASTGESRYRGGEGPLHVLALHAGDDLNPLAVASFAGAETLGFKANPDWNGANAEGAALAQYTIRDGRRDDAATAFLEPVLNRANLTVMVDTRVLGLRIDGRRCTGVQIQSPAGPQVLTALRETVLSAGAVDSPRLLMLSGVGPADALRRLGIRSAVDLPGVGRNLHDHPLVPGILLEAKRELVPSRFNHCETMAIGRSDTAPRSAGGAWADLQLMTLSIPFLSPTLGAAPPNSFSIVPCLMFPRSRGTLTLTDSNPATPPNIDPGYLTEEADVDALIRGMEMSRDLAGSAPMGAWVAREIFPGAPMSRPALGAYLRRVASPFFHPVSTCAMGKDSDALAVVTPDCKVRGLEGLRIVDASIFPSIPQAMTNAAVMAVAERGSDLILGRSA
jgi:choline dehydrogenase